jgi:hypothetical protein
MATLDPSAVWTALNSPFALWFLSSVVIAGITTAFTLYKKNQNDRSEKAANARRLNTELGNRIAEGLVALGLDHKRIDNGKTYYQGSIYCEALTYLNNRVLDGKNVLDFSTYPDFRWRSFRSLIFELSAVAAPSEIPALRNANLTYEKLVDLADQASLAEDYSQPPNVDKTVSAIKESTAILEALQKYSPWKSQL